MPLGNIRRHRRRRTTYLRCHSVRLIARKCLGQIVTGDSQFHCSLPHFQVTTGVDCHIIQLAIRHSLFATRYLLLRLLISRQHILRALPWREEIEIAEFLRQPHLFVDDALLLIVIAHFDKAGEREILA